MKKLISGILVMLFMFMTPISGTNVHAQGDNSSSCSVFSGPIVLALKIILYPVAIVGGTYVVCKGTDKIFNLPENTSINNVKSGVQKVYNVAKNGVNFGLDKLNNTFTGNAQAHAENH